MSKPLVIMVGADKGGVGKTTVSRAMDEYLRRLQVGCKVVDGQFPNGDLCQFAGGAEVVDMQSLDGQMRVFDKLAGVTLIDIKGGLFTDVLQSLNRTGLLEDVREGRFNLVLLHVLGPSAASLAEVASISDRLGDGAAYVLVKNYVNEGGFTEWESDPRFSAGLSRRSIAIPHLEARACTEVQISGLSFGTFVKRAESRILTGYVRAWLNDVCDEFDAAGLRRLVEQSKD